MTAPLFYLARFKRFAMKEYALGQIILAADWIDTKQLSAAINYATSKVLPIGHVIKLLKYISESELADALLMQGMLRDGLDFETGIRLMKLCRQDGIRLDEAIRKTCPGSGKNSRVPSAHGSQAAASPASNPAASPALNPAASPAASPALNPAASPAASPASIDASPAGQADSLKKGHCFFREGKWQEAENAFKQYCVECKDMHGEQSLPFCNALSFLADLYIATERFREAEKLYLKMLEIRKHCLGEHSPFIDQVLEDLADIYWILKEHEHSFHYYSLAVNNRANRLPVEMDRFVNLLKKIHPYFLESEKKKSRRKTGEILLELGVVKEEELGLALRKSISKDVPIGSELTKSGQLDKEALSHALNMQTLVNQKLISLFVAENCSKVALQMGRSFEEFIQQSDLLASNTADELNECFVTLELQETLISLEQEHGPKHHKVAQAAVSLADLHRVRGEIVNAELLYRRALRIWSDATERDELKALCECSRKLADLYMSLEKWIEAEPLLLQCLCFSQKLERGAIDDFRLLLAMVKVKHGQADELACQSMMRSAVSVMDNVIGTTLIPVADLVLMSDCLKSMGLESENQRLILAQSELRKTKGIPVGADLSHWQDM